ncbi:hypothetical protein Pint_36558 [Pistacia integerrima]|uniref:Uncharacterized protein n=1 Tax=Pistacia integerrima TaxID=434235 RepID=A0ACC0Y2P7_9ROSI|nr:hypothetical protein Pint_36558 [Pistacia integerrima]
MGGGGVGFEGLKPSEYSPFLPRNLMFLSDDNLLLENYYVLCNYGVERKNIGKIYKEARDIFRYDFGVLSLKLQAYEKLGLGQSIIGKVIVYSPYILIGDVNMEFVKVLETLKSIGVKISLIEEHSMDQNSYNWSKMLRLLSFFSEMGLCEEQLGKLIRRHPGLLLEGSGDGALALIGLLLKFGSTLDEIDMEMDEIGKIFRSHSMLLDRKDVSEMIRVSPEILSQKMFCHSMIQVIADKIHDFVALQGERFIKLLFVLAQMLKLIFFRGSKVERLPRSRDRERSLMVKAKFLEDVGLIQNPCATERTVKAFRGRGEEFQERFDCIVNAGLDRKDVSEMIRVSPEILSQKKNVIEAKIDFLVHDLGHPISSLLSYPSFLNYSMQRIKLRLSMYNWLTEQGKAVPMFALSTLITCSDNTFMKRFVNQHP